MAAEALAPYVTREPARREQQLQEHHDQLYRVAQKSPDQVRPATAFFARGLTSSELQSLIKETDLEVIDVHVKAPQGNDGLVMSMMLGMADLLATSGNLSSRLSFAIEAEQKCFAKMAEVPGEDAEDLATLASRPFLVYSARVFGPASALVELQNNSNVTSVLLNVRQNAITDFEAQKLSKEPHRYFMPGFHC